ncbi:hypothetical protein P4C99_22095 [Pontiellaceae bacterium B1224]|nr:hypothetical protein [Pontiellaceae bacterium B1224]
MKIALPLLSLILTGCVATRISPKPDNSLSSKALSFIQSPSIQTTAEAIVSENKSIHCFEPMLYVLTLGIIPTHCKYSYDLTVEINDGEKTNLIKKNYIVTTMQGWLPILYPLSPNWKYGSGSDAEELVKNTVLNQYVAEMEK